MFILPQAAEAQAQTRPIGSLDTSHPPGRTSQRRGYKMKLREFVANSLPRVRGRKKKTQQTTGTTTTITAAAVAVATTGATTPSQTTQLPADVFCASPQKLSKQDGNGNWFQISESKLSFFDRLIGKDSPVKRLLGSRERHSAYYAAHDCESVVYQTLDSSTSSCAPVVAEYCGAGLQPHSTSSDLYQCQDACLSPSTCACDDDDDDDDDDDEQLINCDYPSVNCSSFGHAEDVTSLESTSCPGSQRVPRSRSRIRTNPWLPSPRPSPYSIRSFSSPCTSSRSASPSPPPSSSSNTSPLTSPSGNVKLFPGSGHSRWRRHKRHHSEVRVSEVTDLLSFDLVTSDREQYFSTLDSGICEATSRTRGRDHKRGRGGDPGERQKLRRNGWYGPRESNAVNNLSVVRSSTPPQAGAKLLKSKAKPRTVPAHYASQVTDAAYSARGVVQHASAAAHLTGGLAYSTGSASSESPSWPWGCGFFSPTIANRDSACWGSDPESDSECVLLSPTHDICVLTSNIEQLAHNISSEYEDALDTSFQSCHSQQDRSLDSLDVLPDAAKDSDYSTHCCPDEELSDGKDMSCSGKHGPRGGGDDGGDSLVEECEKDQESRTEVLQPGDCCEVQNVDRGDGPFEATREAVTAAITEGFQSLHNQNSHTSDAAVQTDFADDDDDDLTNSDSDWFLGAGSGCATEEEGAADEESSVGDDSDDRKLWLIPDCMQDSTDTGYSSLSRDGHVDVDDELNDGQADNTTARHDNNHGGAAVRAGQPPPPPTDRCPNSADVGKVRYNTTCDSGIFDTRPGSCCIHSAISNVPGIPTTPTAPRGCRVSHRASVRPARYEGGMADDSFDADCDHSRQLHPNFTEFCCCEDSFSDLFSQPARCRDSSDRRVRVSRNRRSQYDNIVPYPFDVTRFDDVISHEQGSVTASKEFTTTSSGRSTARPSPTTSTPSYACTMAHSNFVPDTMQFDGDSAFFFPTSPSRADNTQGADSLPSPIPRTTPSRDALFFSSHPHPDTPSSSRSLRDVTASLEDKVFYLRQGKHLVNRKIREAREEEMLRQQQKLRFQRLLDIHRKQILLETLRDLRQRLESQSARLQASYSAVLDMQKRYA